MVYRVGQMPRGKFGIDYEEYDNVVQQTIQVIENRIAATGVEGRVTRSGVDKLEIELGTRDPKLIELFQWMLSMRGSLEVLPVFEADDGFELGAMRKRFQRWLARPANRAEIDHDPTKAARCTEDPTLRWTPMYRSKDATGAWDWLASKHPAETEHFLPLRVPEEPQDDWIADSLHITTDAETGARLLSFELVPGTVSSPGLGPRPTLVVVVNGYIWGACKRIPAGRLLVPIPTR